MRDEKPNVFVIHGHNELARLELCEMLSTEFGLHPVVLGQQAGLSRTIIESLEQHAPRCVLAVGLLTADDLSMKGQEPTVRARQNVIFEIGYFCESLGRDRVCLVREESVEPPSDLNGILYYPFKSSVREVYQGLRKHIEKLGFLDGQVRSMHTIVVVDDDLTVESPVIKELEVTLAGRARMEIMQDPKKAVSVLSSGRKFLGCITDIVFRDSSPIAGVRVAETALRNNIKVLVLTGHKKEDLGIALTELTRIGLPGERILTKPVTPKQFRSFLEKIKGYFGGPDS